MAVGEAPGEDGAHRRLVEHDLEEAAILVGDHAVAAGDVAGRRGIDDVEFGDRHLDAEPGDLGEEGAQLLGRERLHADLEMALDAEQLDRDAVAAQPLEMAQDDPPLGVIRRAVIFDAVFVEQQPRRRVGFARRVEGEIEIMRSDLLGEDRAAQPVGAAMGGLERLVDDVPQSHTAAIAPGDGGNVVEHLAFGGGRIGELAEPARRPVVPEQRMAAHGDAVRGGEIDDDIGRGEIIDTGGVADIAPFQLVLGDQRGAFAADEGGEIVIGNDLAGGDGAAIEETARRRRRAQRLASTRRIRRSPQHRGACHACQAGDDLPAR